LGRVLRGRRIRGLGENGLREGSIATSIYLPLSDVASLLPHSAPSIVGKVGKVVRKVEETFRGVTSTSDTSFNKFTPQHRKAAAFSFDSPHPTADSSALHSMRSSHLPSYSPCVRYQRGEMRLHIYVRTALVPALTDVEVVAENTGIGHFLANKGGIAARITFTDTSLSFVTCHIQAHEGKEHFQRRCNDISEVRG
jgi:hypothetical protein